MLPLPAPSHLETYVVDGTTREALVFDGAGAAPKEGRPLVLAVRDRWPEATAIYPEGLRTGWPREGEGDLRFVDAILARAKPATDGRRVYAMGHSNGGLFTYVLWANRADRFAAYGLSGSPAIGVGRRLTPASAFLTAGGADPAKARKDG